MMENKNYMKRMERPQTGIVRGSIRIDSRGSGLISEAKIRNTTNNSMV